MPRSYYANERSFFSQGEKFAQVLYEDKILSDCGTTLLLVVEAQTSRANSNATAATASLAVLKLRETTCERVALRIHVYKTESTFTTRIQPARLRHKNGRRRERGGGGEKLGSKKR